MFRSRKAAAAGRLTVIEVLHRGRGAKKWHVVIDGREIAQFGRVSDAVEATDFEIHRMGRVAMVTAQADAAWRSEAVPAALADAVASLRRPAPPQTWGEAVRALGFERHARLRAGRRR